MIIVAFIWVDSNNNFWEYIYICISSWHNFWIGFLNFNLVPTMVVSWAVQRNQTNFHYWNSFQTLYIYIQQRSENSTRMKYQILRMLCHMSLTNKCSGPFRPKSGFRIVHFSWKGGGSVPPKVCVRSIFRTITKTSKSKGDL